MNEEVLRKLYESGTSIFDLPPFEQFVVDMQDESKLIRFRESMLENFDIPDLETFKSDIGFTSASAPIVEEEVEEVTTERVGNEIVEGDSYSSVNNELVNEDLTPTEGAETITENVKYDETEEGGTFDLTSIGEDDTITYDADATPFERSLAFINKNLFTRDEEPVVNRLNYHFNDYGFEFEESGVFDNVTVTATKTGAQEQFKIDSWFAGDNSQEARALRDFLRKNQDASVVSNLQANYDASKKKYFSAEARLNDIKAIQKNSASISSRFSKYLDRKSNHEEQMLRFSNAEASMFQDPEFAEAYQLELEEGRYLAKQGNVLNQQFSAFSDNAKDVDVAVGNYVRMKEQDGTAVGTAISGFYNKFVGYFDSALTTIGGTGLDLFYNVAQGISGNDYGMDEDEYRAEFIRVYEGYKGVLVPESAKESIEGFTEWSNSLKDQSDIDSLVEKEGIEDISSLSIRTGTDLGAKPKDLKGNALQGEYLIVKDDPRLSRLPNGVYDIRKGIRYDWGSDGIGMSQPLMKYDKPLLYSIEEDEWVSAPPVFGISNIFEQIDDLVGDQKVKKKKKSFKDESRSFFQDLIGVANVSEERVQAQMNQGGASGIVMTGLYGAAESLPALIPMIVQAIKQKKLPKGNKQSKKFMKRMGQAIKAWATDGYRQSTLIGMALLHADKLNEQMELNPEFEWISENEKKAIVLPLAITSGILESVGFRNLLTGKSATGFITKITSEALAKLPKGATPAMFRKAVLNVLDNSATRGIAKSGAFRFASRVTPAALSEAETGALQEITDIGGKDIYNSIKGKDLFKNPEAWSMEYWKQVGHSAAAEAVGGFALASPYAIMDGIYGKNPGQTITNQMIEMFNQIKNDPTYVKGFEAKNDTDVAQGLISKIEGKTRLLNFNILRKASTDLDVASDLSESQKVEALQLIFKKNRLTNEMEGMDPDLGTYQDKQTQLDAIKVRLGEIGSKEADNKAKLKKEQSDLPTFVSEEDAINELNEEGVENPTPEQIKTKQDALQKQSTTKVDASESSTNSSEMGKGDSKSESSEQGPKKIKGKPKKTNALENENETEEEISTETKEDIDSFFDENTETNEIVTPNISRNKSKNPNKRSSSFQTTLIKNAKKAAKSVNKYLPKVRFVIHDNSEQFKKATGKLTKGFYNSTSQTIHINMEEATTSTPYHEVVHAISNALISTDAKTTAVFNRMLISLKKILPAQEGNLNERIEKFISKYESEDKSEEAFSELMGVLAAEYGSLKKPAQNKLIKLLNRFFKKIGIKTPFSETLSKSDEEVIDFLNLVSGKLRRGEEIVESDVKIISDITAELDSYGTAPIGNPTTIVLDTDERKNKEQKVDFDGDYVNSLISPENELDITPLLNDIESKNQNVWFWVADQLGVGEVNGNVIDGGPSYPFVQENKDNDIVWASGLKESSLEKNAKNADYIFIISGSPQASLLANKNVFDIFTSKLGDFNTFKNNINNFNKQPIKVVRDIVEKYDSWDAIKNAKSNTTRKSFLAGIIAQENTPNTELHKLISESDGFIDIESLRDGFYKENNFELNDVLLVLKPKGVKANSNHSTYQNDILGEVLGVPNKKINAFDLMPEVMRENYEESLSASQQSQVVAPYGSGVRKIQAPKSKRKNKEQKITTELDLINQTYMPDSGYYSAQAMVSDIQRQWNRVGPGYVAKRAALGNYGGGGGVFVSRPNGSRVIPKNLAKKSRKNKYQLLDNESDAMNIVITGREAGFNNGELSYYMKRKGFSIKEIKDALKIDTDLFTTFPKSFTNIEGGLKKGVPLLNKINEYYKKLLTANNRKRKNKVSNEDLVNETIEYMYTLPEYVNEGGKGSRRTSQQQAMEVDILNYLSPDTNARNGLRIFNLNKNIRDIKWAQGEAKRIQRKLRQYIRSVMPRDPQNKSAYISLIDKVNAVDKTNFKAIVEEITDKVTTITNTRLESSIIEILNKQFQAVMSGRLKGVGVTTVVRDRIRAIQKNIIGYVPGKKGQPGKIEKSKNTTADEINDKNEKLLNEITKLETEKITISGVETTIDKTLTPEEAQFVADLTIALAYNNTLLMEQTNSKKTNAYEQILFGLNQLQDIGVTGLQLQLLKDSTKYMNNALGMLKEMGVIIDPLQELKDSGKKNITQADVLQKFRDLKKKIKVDNERGKLNPITLRKRLALGIKNSVRAAEAYVLGSAEDLTGLMDRVSLSTGELFGGFAQEVVGQEIRKATRLYKGRMLNHELALNIKMTELFGKGWTKVNRKNSNQDESLLINEAKQTLLENEKTRIEKDSKMESGEKVVLLQAINEEMNNNNIMISKNELLYYRNQGGDPSLLASFDETFMPTDFSGVLAYLNKGFKIESEYSSRIKEEIESKLGDKLIDLGDWMVNEFYPSQYDYYNETYNKVYRTDMPWNKYYAGRLYRKGEDNIVGLDLLSSEGNKSWITNVSAASTKFRMENANPIGQFNALDALLNYTRDMEYFAAYALPIKNINKIFQDSAVKEVINEKYGAKINDYIQDQIEKIANKGAKHQKGMELVNFFNNTFLLSRLGFNPTLILKQMTSFVTYGNDIGYDNWIKYAAGSIGSINSDLKEIMSNSVVLQDRYGKPISRVIETYQDKTYQRLDAQNSLINKYFNRETQNTLTNMLMSFTMLGDKGAIMLGGLPNYKFYKAQYFSENENANDQDAIDYAIKRFEDDTLRTQQSYDLQDKDYYQTGNSLERAFNMFLTTPKQYLRREIIAARNFSRLVRSGKKQGKGTYWQNLRTLATYHFVMPSLFKFVSMGAPGLLRDRREDDLEEILYSSILGNLNALFILGDVLNTVKDTATGKYWADKPTSIPILEQAATLSRLWSQFNNTKDPVKSAEYETRFWLELTTLSGIPAPQLKRLFENYSDVITGDTKNMGDMILKLFNFGDYVREGQKKKKSNPKPATMTEAEMKRYFPDEYRQQQQDLADYELEYADEIREYEEEVRKTKEETKRLMDEYYLNE